MYQNFEVSEECLDLWNLCRNFIPEMLEGCTVKNKNVKIVKSRPIDPKSKSLYLIKEGMISETYKGQVVVNHEARDLIGVESLLQEKLTLYENEFAVIVDEYDGKEFLEQIYADKNKYLTLNKYLSCMSQSNQLLMSGLIKEDVGFLPEFRHYNKGDVIIEESTSADEVFTLMTGSTKVIVDNTEVGVINKNEIFGAIAALTNTPRTASIIATSEVETMVVKKDSFFDLLAARPDTVQQLVSDMARTIVSCNEKIMDLSETKK